MIPETLRRAFEAFYPMPEGIIMREYITPRPLFIVMEDSERFILWMDGIDGEPRLCRRARNGRIYINGGPLSFNATKWLNCPAVPLLYLEPERKHPCLPSPQAITLTSLSKPSEK